MINREELKSDYLETVNGKPTRFVVKSDAGKVEKLKKDNSGKYVQYEFTVSKLGSEESKKMSLFRRDYKSMVMQADGISPINLDTLVGCVFDITTTISEVDGKTNYDTKLVLISCPVEKVEESSKDSSTPQLSEVFW